MCQYYTLLHSCGCPVTYRHSPCALPSQVCDEAKRNPPAFSDPKQCPQHRAGRVRESTPSALEQVHPALRPIPPPTPPIPISLRAGTNNSFAGYSSATRTSGRMRWDPPTPKMSATITHPARDLKRINMPARRQSSHSSDKFKATIKDYAEIPEIPVLPPTPRRSTRQRTPTRTGPLEYRPPAVFASSSSRNPKVSNDRVRKQRAPTPPSYDMEEAHRQARLQDQQRIIENRALRDKCRDLIESGRYTEEQVRQHRVFLQLPRAEQDELIHSYKASLRKSNRSKKSTCATM